MTVSSAPPAAEPFTLLPRLRKAVDAIHVDASRRTAQVGGTRITADVVPGLRHALADKVYEVLHAGLDTPEGPRPRTLRDQRYETLLAQAVPHEETVLTVTAEAIIQGADGLHPTVVLDGVRTAVPAHRLSPGPEAHLVRVRYPCARPCLSPGFFLVRGSVGRPHSAKTLRLYIHIQDSEKAPEIWRVLLLELEHKGVPYQAKVSSSPLLYPRRDAAVVYLDAEREGEEVAVDVAEAVAGQPGLGTSTSVFTREIAPGLALAAEPDDPRKGMSQMSFGQHRSHAVAQGLIDHALAPTGTDKHTAVAGALVHARIRPDAPWHNTPL